MANVLLNFEDLDAGDIVNNQYQGDGVTITSYSGSNPAMVFDTANPTGGDWDLATGNLGNVLIISEDGDSSDPDDNAGGGKLIFDFDEPTEIKSFTVLDTEEQGYVKLYDENGDLIEKIKLPETPDGGQANVEINVDGVSKMVIELKGSGAVDNILYNTPAPEGDGYVEGTAGDDVIDVAYTGDPDGDMIDAGDAILPGEAPDDDIVLAGAGDDTVLAGAGDDDVYAGSGDDYVEGGAGDDLILGDGSLDGAGGASEREVFEWDKAPGYGDENDASGFTQDTGNVEVTFSIVSQTGNTEVEYETSTGNVGNIVTGGLGVVNPHSNLALENSGEDSSSMVSLDFSSDVTNVDFRINDIDYDSQVTVQAYDADGNLIPVTLSGGTRLTLSDTDTVAGDDTATSEGGGGPTADGAYSLRVEIGGPVAQIVITHTQVDDDTSHVQITDIYYDTYPGDTGPDGNDTLLGGEGDDTILGQGGDDTITGGAGADDLSGGDDRDTFIGGNAGDHVDGGEGGDDYDTLDLSGEGPLTVEYDPGNPENGTVTFLDGDGNPAGTLTFENIENVILPPNTGPTANDDVAEVDEDGAVDIDVLDNDTDPDFDDLEVISASADNGTVTINPDGTLHYEPDPDYNGPDTITYVIDDGNGGQDTGEVSVTVYPVNDDPVANDDAATTPYDTPVTVDVVGNDTDVDGDTLEVLGTPTSPDGTVVVNPDGTITFTPNAGFEGNATVTYEVTDGNGGTDTGELIVTVEANPLDGIVEGTGGDDLIDLAYTGDPEGDMVDNLDEILPGEGPNDDIIEAYDGDDTVYAGEGNDEVDGGAGDDVIHGESGDDEIIGGDGSDTVFGGTGDDVIDTSGSDPRSDYGWPGVFPPDADPFDDRDVVDGGDGDDTITTGDDVDIITGGAGEDTIDGGLDDDVIDGGADDDFIIGGHGSDTIDGGDGNDTIYGGMGPGTDPFNIPDENIPGDIYPLPDPVTDNGIDVIHGGAGNDTIYGQDDADELYGDDGQDYIDGGIDNDFIDGGTGADTLIGGQGDDTILGGTGLDTIEGGDGDDIVDGGQGSDQIFGGAGDDYLDGGTGGDYIDGGEGEDTILGTTGRDTLLGGAGDDDISAGLGEDVIDGGDGDDVIDAGGDDDVVEGGAGMDSITGGAGNDILSGGDDQDTFTGLNAGDDVDGGAGGVDYDVLDLTGSAPGGGSLQVTITGPDSNGNGSDGYVTYYDSSGNVTGTLNFTEIEEIVPCFTPGTRIATPKGERLVEDLQPGDRVITRDNGIQEISWVGHKAMDWKTLSANAHLKPVLIQAGSLGNGLPEQDMLVSPNHRVLVANDRTALYFEEREVLVSAKHLVDNRGVHRVDTMGTSYIHFMFEHHEVVLSNGAWTESFQPGDYSLKGIGNAQRGEIFELFPELETAEGIGDYAAARRTLKKFEAKMLLK